MLMNLGSIYIIENKLNEKVYIGQTINTIEQRFQEHVSKARTNNKQMYLSRAIRKHGEENFTIRELERCPLNTITEREKYYIEKYDSILNGYNTALASDSYYLSRQHFDIEEIKTMYLDQHMSLEHIADKFNTRRFQITQALKKNGIEIRKKSKTIKSRNREYLKDVEALIKDGNSLRKIAKILNFSYSTIRNYCIENKIEYNSPTSARHSLSENVC